MRNIRTFAALLAASALTLLAAAPAHAAVTPGARYDGVGSKPKVRQFITVAKSGSRLSKYAVAANGSCNDGKRYFTSTNEIKEPPVVIKPDGSFASMNTPLTIVTKRGKKRYRGKISVNFTGTSSADGSQLTVTVTGSFRGQGLRCRTSATTVFGRDGSPSAPFSNALLTTGPYPGTTAPGVRIGAFSVLAPGGEFRGFDARVRVRCPRSKDFDDRYALPLGVLSLRGTFTANDIDTGKLRNGYRFKTQARVTLQFFRRGTTYGYRGSFRGSLLFTKGTERERCSIPLTRFEATRPAA